MKKAWIVLVIISLIMFTGCSSNKSTDSSTLDAEALLKDMSGVYVCTIDDGYGYDYEYISTTYLYLSTDGSFDGNYYVPDYSEDLEKTVLCSSFSGSLQNVMPMGKNQYYTDVSKLDYGNINVEAISPHIFSYYQLDIYTPETICSHLPDEAIKWLEYNGVLPEDEKDPIGMYILYNQESGFTYYQAIKKELTPPVTQSESKGTKEYYGENLLSMKISDILDLMDREITVASGGNYYYIDQNKDVYFYNFKKLPGFMFYIQPSAATNASLNNYTEAEIAEIKDDILKGKYDMPKCIVMMDGARLNDEIGTNMTYCQISYMRKDYTVDSVTAQNHNATQDVSYYSDNNDILISAKIEYEEPKEATGDSMDGRYMDIFSLIRSDPKVRYISAFVK